MDFINSHPSGGKILDYGCGTGSKSIKFASPNWKLTGIDISYKSIEIANKNRNSDSEFFVMDCEKMDFADDIFDLVFDYGTFSSLDLEKALPELIRVLKPSGSLIAIETLGHNPLTNLKRKINVLLGTRTKWASDHIMKMQDWNKMSENFRESKIRFFGCLSLILIPLIRISPAKYRSNFIRRVQKLDYILSNKKCFQKFAFKTVVILKTPK